MHALLLNINLKVKVETQNYTYIENHSIHSAETELVIVFQKF